MADTDFQGYLIAYVKGSTVKPFPHEYICWDEWETDDDQREYIKAYRDDNTRDIFLIQAQGQKTAIQFKLRDNLRLADIRKINKWFSDGEIDHDIRSITIKYWNSVLTKYDTITCYQANPKFKIKKITDTDIIYRGRTVDLVEM